MRTVTLRAVDCILYINGQPAAIVTHLGWRVNYGHGVRYGIDVLTPQEIFTERQSTTLTMNYIRKHNTAGAEGVGLIPPSSDLSRERYAYIQVVDRQQDVTYHEIPKAKLVEQSGEVAARGVATGTLTLEGIDWSNDF